MGKIVLLDGNAVRRNEEAVKFLQNLLDLAEKGKIVSVGVCWVTAEHRVGVDWRGSPSSKGLGTAVGLLQHEYFSAVSAQPSIEESSE